MRERTSHLAGLWIGMDVCLLWVLCVVRWRSLRRADHSSIGVLPTVVCRCMWSRNHKNPREWREGQVPLGGYRAKKERRKKRKKKRNSKGPSEQEEESSPLPAWQRQAQGKELKQWDGLFSLIFPTVPIYHPPTSTFLSTWKMQSNDTLLEQRRAETRRVWIDQTLQQWVLRYRHNCV